MSVQINDQVTKLFNEEGTVIVRKEHVRCCVATPDRDQIDRFAAAVGYGRITKQSQCNQTLYVWSAYNMQALSFLHTLLPHLTGRRKEQALVAIG